jgi:hypothetical protein
MPVTAGKLCDPNGLALPWIHTRGRPKRDYRDRGIDFGKSHLGRSEGRKLRLRSEECIWQMLSGRCDPNRQG